MPVLISKKCKYSFHHAASLSKSHLSFLVIQHFVSFILSSRILYSVCVCIYIYVNSWNCAIRSVGTGRIFIRLIPDLSDRLVPDSPGVAMSHGAFLEAQSRAHSDP